MLEFTTKEYWLGFINTIVDWVVKEIPVMLVLIILFVIALKIEWFLFDKFKAVLLKKAGEHHTGVQKAEAEKRITTLMGIIKRLGRLVIWVVFGMIILRQLGLDIAPILAGAGIVGLAVGFGAQELVRDFISGFFMLMEDQIRRGDYAEINGVGGMVEKIELRTVVLRDMTGTVHIFQNGRINTLSNMTKEWSAIVLEIGVAYKEDVDAVMNIMKSVGEKLATDPEYKDIIIEPIEILGLDKFGDSALVIKTRLKTVPMHQWAIGREYRRRIKYAFDENNIEIPFPHTTVYWGEEINPLKLNVLKGE
ncbi:MAG TPA: mechanosensitive ion channel family protein [Clostridiales bacterium]|nr:mechanosensitive ion channel family protein [Clostridiales bacterium]